MSKVYTVIGEFGNCSGPYTQELPSIEAALDAIAKEQFPLLPHGYISEPYCRCIVEHDPREQVDSHTFRGGIQPGARVYELLDGTVGTYGDARRTLDEDVPEAWAQFRADVRRVNEGRTNVHGTYRHVLRAE